VVSYRPEYGDEWRNRPNYRLLHLDPLISESLAELLQALLGSDPSLPSLKSLLVERASGNPFFIEELVRVLVDTGVLKGARGSYGLARPFSSIEVPPTVQAVLAARIDALPAAEKRLLHEAAVIGHDIPFTLLHAICELTEDELRGLLDNLQAAELLYATQLFPDLQYTFRHSLTHEVTYRGVLRERRRNIHARVVDAIEKLYADRLGEQVERLAHHAVRAELQEKAVHYLRQAGAKAAARSALSDARTWFEQAISILKALPESEAALEQAVDTRLEIRQVLVQLSEFRASLKLMREAESLAERLNDDRRLARVCAYMTGDHSMLGQLDDALVTGTRAAGIAGRLGDLRLRILTATYLERVYFVRGQYNQAVELATDNLAVLPSEWVHDYFGMASPLSVYDRVWLILSLAHVGKFAEGMEHATEAIHFAQSTHRPHPICLACYATAALHLLKGDWEKARPPMETVISTHPMRDTSFTTTTFALSAWVLAQLGEASEASRRLRESEEFVERLLAKGTHVFSGWDYHALGRACLLLGRLDEARRLANRAVELSSAQLGFAAYALHLLGDIATNPDRFDAETGAAYYRQALTLAEPRGMRPLVAHCHRGLAELYRRTSEGEKAEKHVATATTMYRDMDMRFWLETAGERRCGP
jgi:tetratricopeptide (TPR) repeat protein